MCDECQGQRCGGKFAPFFCANVTCLQVNSFTSLYIFLLFCCFPCRVSRANDDNNDDSVNDNDDDNETAKAKTTKPLSKKLKATAPKRAFSFVVVAVLLRALLGDDSLATRSRVPQAVGEGGCGSTSGRAVPLVLTPAALSLIISQP